jgi:chorismate synthase
MFKNSFGSVFKITTFGESHGSNIGVVIDGCPSGINIDEEEINAYMALRSPNKPFTSTRKEHDKVEILSGVYRGKTTGAPICLMIKNEDVKRDDYDLMKDVLRPGHANLTYRNKYGFVDDSGGARASGRETASRVAASVIAKKFLEINGIKSVGYLKAVGDISLSSDLTDSVDDIMVKRNNSPIFTIDLIIEEKMIARLKEVQENKDSIGSLVGFKAIIPPNLGEPIFEKLPAKIGAIMLSIPGVKGFEIGDGFSVCRQLGSYHNDQFAVIDGKVVMKTNHAGGVLGGISTGMPLIGAVVFKPPSTIGKEQISYDFIGKEALFLMSDSTRHDTVIGIRGAIVVEACLNLALVDLLLLNRLAKA